MYKNRAENSLLDESEMESFVCKKVCSIYDTPSVTKEMVALCRMINVVWNDFVY